jgi:hypothetical protein
VSHILWVEILGWEDPPPPRGGPERDRPRNEMADAVAAQLRMRPGRWAKVYDGPRSCGTGLASHIRSGALSGFGPGGDFDACSRLIDDRRVVYARYLGDGDVVEVAGPRRAAGHG